MTTNDSKTYTREEVEALLKAVSEGADVVVTVQPAEDRVLQGSYALGEAFERFLEMKEKMGAYQAALHDVRSQGADNPQDGLPITGKRAEAVHNGATALDAASTLQEFKHALVYKGTAAEAADYLDDADRLILLMLCQAIVENAGLELRVPASGVAGNSTWSADVARLRSLPRNRERDGLGKVDVHHASI